MNESPTIDETTEVAMAIILAAGEARTLTMSAVDAIANPGTAVPSELLEQAQVQIRKGHQAQTSLIQGEAAGRQVPHSLLFSHAQDTLMNVMSEHALVRRLLPVFEGLEARISTLEASRG